MTAHLGPPDQGIVLCSFLGSIWTIWFRACISDASLGAGCCLTRYLEQPVSWRSRRQALVSLSVAEAEYIETISATQMAYGISAITEELHQEPAEIVIKVDNAAAVGFSSGSWKTRHSKDSLST